MLYNEERQFWKWNDSYKVKLYGEFLNVIILSKCYGLTQIIIIFLNILRVSVYFYNFPFNT